MAVEAPAHGQWRRPGASAACASTAPWQLVQPTPFATWMRMVEIDVIRQPVTRCQGIGLPPPGSAAPAPASAHWSRAANGRSCRSGSAAARRSGFLHRGVAIAAVDPEAADMVLVAERHRLAHDDSCPVAKGVKARAAIRPRPASGSSTTPRRTRRLRVFALGAKICTTHQPRSFIMSNRPSCAVRVPVEARTLACRHRSPMAGNSSLAANRGERETALRRFSTTPGRRAGAGQAPRPAACLAPMPCVGSQPAFRATVPTRRPSST